MEEIITILQQLHIPYSLVSHEAVYSVLEAKEKVPSIDGVGCKSLFLKDQHQHYYLYVLHEDDRANFKYVEKKLACGHLCFASEGELKKYLNLSPGSVTPCGVLYDTEQKVIVLIDHKLKDQKILLHPNANTAMIAVTYEDLRKLLTFLKHRYIEI